MCPGAHATSKVTGSITLFFRHHSFSIKAAESGAVKIAALNLLPPLGKASPKNSLRLYRRPSVGILETIHTFCVVVWTGPYPLCAGQLSRWSLAPPHHGSDVTLSPPGRSSRVVERPLPITWPHTPTIRVGEGSSKPRQTPINAPSPITKKVENKPSAAGQLVHGVFVKLSRLLSSTSTLLRMRCFPPFNTANLYGQIEQQVTARLNNISSKQKHLNIEHWIYIQKLQNYLNMNLLILSLDTSGVVLLYINYNRTISQKEYTYSILIVYQKYTCMVIPVQK